MFTQGEGFNNINQNLPKEGENIKLLTINTHSIVEPDYEVKLNHFIDGIAENPPDIIAMQEVNQSLDKEILPQLPGFMPCTTRAVRTDNHALRVVMSLRERGIKYNWTWVPIKIGYGKYEEGLAILSRYPVNAAESIYISKTSDYNNWKTRRILGIITPAGKFYTVHMGWWDDESEPFSEQWRKVKRYITGKAWLMGDFNSPDDIRGEGYDAVEGSGWQDVYVLAQHRDAGYTVTKRIDGWDCDERMRIDYIWCNHGARVERVETVFDGMNGCVVSDHFGVMAEVR